MFKITTNAQYNKVLTATDRDGGEFEIEFYDEEAVEIFIFNDSKCLMLDKEQAISFAKAIIDQFKKPSRAASVAMHQR